MGRLYLTRYQPDNSLALHCKLTYLRVFCWVRLRTLKERKKGEKRNTWVKIIKPRLCRTIKRLKNKNTGCAVLTRSSGWRTLEC